MTPGPFKRPFRQTGFVPEAAQSVHSASVVNSTATAGGGLGVLPVASLDFGPPFREPCGGWPAAPRSPQLGCYQHRKDSEKSVAQWMQSTLVSDWRCPPGGTQTESCNPGPHACTPDALFSGTGIPPYPRLSDSGGGLTCSGGPNRCDPVWPASTLGNCPGPCASGCGNRAGEPKCNAWFAYGGTLTESPLEWLGCHAVDATHGTVASNCFTASGTNLDLSLCRKIGFKNIQVWKAWHGKYGYLSHDNAASQVDLVRNFAIGTADCAPGINNTVPAPCAGQSIEFEQRFPDLTRYLTESANIVFSSTDGFTGVTVSANLSRSATINRLSSLQTRSCSDAGTDAGTIATAHATLFPNGVYQGRSDLTGSPGVADVFPKSSLYGVMFNAANFNNTFGCTFDMVTSYSGSSVTFIAYNTGTSNIYQKVVVDTEAGTLHFEAWGNDNSVPPNYVIVATQDVTLSNTSYTSTWTSQGPASNGHWTTSHYTISGALSDPYGATDVHNDWVALRQQWNLSDDLQYPWRTDEYCSVAPVVHYNENFGNVSPALGECFNDYPTNTVPYVDGNAVFFDGSIKGGPVPHYGLSRGYFDFKHQTWRACCGDNSTVSIYRYAYGAFAGETNASDPTDAGIPRTATEWTENANPTAVAGNCLRPGPCGDGWPFGPAHGYSGLFTTFPCDYTPGSLPAGQWKFYIPGGVLYGQEWAEIKVPRPSLNFARPCGPDRYIMDETTVRCVQTGATLNNVNISSSTPINTGDLVWVCGVSGLADAVYTATKNSATNYSLAVHATAPGYRYTTGDCHLLGGNGIIGKVRFANVPGICGEMEIVNVFGTVASSGVRTEVATAGTTQLATGDAITISGVSGINVNGNWTIDAMIDATHFLVNLASTGQYAGGGQVVSAGAAAPQWNDNAAKGEFVYASWTMNERDYQERQRVVDQYAACGYCSDAAPLSTALIRANQVLHGMPQAVISFGTVQGCLPFDVCNPQVMAITSNGSNQFTNPNGEHWPNAYVVAPFALKLDGRYGSMQQSAFIQHITDPLWMAPHKPCVNIELDGQGPTACRWVEDDGSCLADTCLDDSLGGGIRYYAREPYVEDRLSVPVGAPALPAGFYLGYLSLAQLDTPNAVNGNVLPPPTGPGYPEPDAFNHATPFTNVTPWGIYIREYLCECATGRFQPDYLAQGVSVHCP